MAKVQRMHRAALVAAMASPLFLSACNRVNAPSSNSDAGSVQTLSASEGSTLRSILTNDRKNDGRSRSLCALGSQSDSRLASFAPANSGNGAIAVELGALQIAHNGCGTPSNTAGPFFDPDKNTFVTLNLPLVLETIDGKAMGLAGNEKVSLARLYSFRDNGVWDDVYAKTTGTTRPAIVPSTYEMYDRIPSNGSWLAIGKNEGDSRRVAMFGAPGGLSNKMYVERDGGVFYLSRSESRTDTDYANEFAFVTSIIREPSGNISEVGTVKVYQKATPPVVEGLAHSRWYYDQGVLMYVENAFTGKNVRFSYMPNGTLHKIFNEPAAGEEPDTLVSTEYSGSRLVHLESQANHKFDYDALGRLQAITEIKDGKNYLVANVCYQFSPDNATKRLTVKAGHFAGKDNQTTASPSAKNYLMISSSALKDSNLREISITDASAVSNKMTLDNLGRILELVTTNTGTSSSATTTRRFTYSPLLYALASSIEEVGSDGKKSTTNIAFSDRGEKKLITVDGKITYEVKSWFDDVIPKVFLTGANLVELEASAAPLTANYRKTVDGKLAAETSAKYRAMGNNTAVRIAELVVNDLVKDQVITTTFDENGTPTRTVTNGEGFKGDTEPKQQEPSANTAGLTWIEPEGCGSLSDGNDLKGWSSIGSKSSGDVK